MNTLLFRPEQRQAGVVTADARQARHIAGVLNTQPGDTLRVGELGGMLGEARLLDAPTSPARLEIIHLDRPPPPKLPLTVILAMPRPKVLRRLFQALASLGVPHIILLNAWRVEKSYWQTPWLQPGAIEENLWLGLEQAGDTLLPQVTIRKRFKPFVEDELPNLLADAHGWLAHPGLAATPPTTKAGPQGRPTRQTGDADPSPPPVLPTVLAIGPEGGFIPYEVERLLASGLNGLSLGPRILRVDTAVATLIGKLFY